MPIRKELAKKRHESQRDPKTGQYEPLGPIGPQGRARDQVAEAARVSPRTFERAKVILEYGSEALKQACREERENRQFYECV